VSLATDVKADNLVLVRLCNEVVDGYCTLHVFGMMLYLVNIGDDLVLERGLGMAAAIVPAHFCTEGASDLQTPTGEVHVGVYNIRSTAAMQC
jgi:hypothetical protein